jgi:DNA-binding transcriptional ArsR family regulator
VPHANAPETAASVKPRAIARLSSRKNVSVGVMDLRHHQACGGTSTSGMRPQHAGIRANHRHSCVLAHECIIELNVLAQQASSAMVTRLPRVELFRLLAEPGRLQLLALCEEEELSVSELATLLDDSQPQVSRKVAPLREAGLLDARKDGTRLFLRTDLKTIAADPVLGEALAEGRRLCLADGSLSRVPSIVAAREEQGRSHFEQAPTSP